MTRSIAPWVVAMSILVPSSARAQELLRERDGGFGLNAAGLSDLDGDSVRDYALVLQPAKKPIVRVYSGASGKFLFSVLDGQSNSDDFAWFPGELASAGDLDGDGVPDFLIGADDYVDPNQSYVFPGAVIACSGQDGHVIQTLYGSGDNERLGTSVAGIDDVDGDGTSDFLAGATEYDWSTGASVGNGYVRCYSGRTGAILYQVDGALFGDGFAHAVPLSDHDGDGLRDFAVKAASETRICSGATGATIASIPPSAGAENTVGVAEVDDLDGDGEPEIAIGEINYVGQVRVISIPTQTQLRIHVGNLASPYFGNDVATISDADGDGVRDYLISDYGTVVGNSFAAFYSGRTGECLHSYYDLDSTYFFDPSEMGFSIADLGDLDQDGRAEIVIGSPLHTNVGVADGAALVYSGNDLWLNAEPKMPYAGDVESLIVHGAPTGNPVVTFLTAVNGAPTFQLLGGGISDAVESFTLSGTVPPGLFHVTMTFHAYALDAASNLMSSADEIVDFQR